MTRQIGRVPGRHFKEGWQTLGAGIRGCVFVMLAVLLSSVVTAVVGWPPLDLIALLGYNLLALLASDIFLL